MARRAGAFGPYEHRGKWRVVVVDDGGGRVNRSFKTRGQAEAFRREVARQLTERPARTVADAVEEYGRYLAVKGNKPKSYEETLRRLRRFFGEELGQPLANLSPKRTAALYEALTAQMAADSHRNILAETRTFLEWCKGRGWLRANPLNGVRGTGKRKHGKAQLRIDEARRWLAKAWELADRGELGAVAALCALLLGMRAGEIIERHVRDLDDGGRLLWIPSSKTEAGRRTLEIPEALQPYLRRLAADRHPEDLLFGRHWRDWPREWVQRICDIARVPRVTAHGMRGMHSTLALQAGTSGHIVAASLGHESISTTLQSYANPTAVESAKRHRALTVLQGGGGEDRKGETKNAGEFVSPAFPQ